MLSLLFHFCYEIISIQIEVGPIIIWLVVSRVYRLEDKWGDVVGSDKMCDPVIDVDATTVKE